MKYLVRFYRADGEQPCGTGYNRVEELKTIRGVLNRQRGTWIPKDVIKFTIEKFSYRDEPILYSGDIEELRWGK